MNVLGVAGLADIEPFLQQRYPTQMAATSRIMQGMDAAAALVQDGQVIAAASQERFVRQKKSGAFPFAAIDYCLDVAGIDLTQVDYVCTNFNFRRFSYLYRSSQTAREYWTRCLSPDA